MTFPHLRGKQPWMFTCSRYLPFSLWRHHRKCLWMHFILHSNKVHSFSFFSFFFTKEERAKCFQISVTLQENNWQDVESYFQAMCTDVFAPRFHVSFRKWHSTRKPWKCKATVEHDVCTQWAYTLNCYLFKEMTECFCSEHTYRGDIDLSDLGWPDVWTILFLSDGCSYYFAS